MAHHRLRARQTFVTHVTRLQLHVVRSATGRLSGRLVLDDNATDVPFDGTLDLLRRLEELVSSESADPDSPPEGTQ